MSDNSTMNQNQPTYRSHHNLHDLHLPQLLQQWKPTWAKELWLIDVGCSGGIHPSWQVFEEKLHAVGVDPLVSEVNRLNAENKLPGVTYIDAFVATPEYSMQQSPLQCHLFSSTSATSAMELMKLNYTKEIFNTGGELVFSSNKVTVDEVAAKHHISDCDVLKIDTDGHDYPVLQSAGKLLQDNHTICVDIEVQLHGEPGSETTTYSNIDNYLRERGFSLFMFEVFRYSRAELPMPFHFDIPAQTTSGQVMWAEGVYFRDLTIPNYETKFNFTITEEKVLKLACLYELYELRDCAANLLIKFADRFSYKAILPQLLDALTPEWLGEKQTYDQWMARFRSNPKSFYPEAIKEAMKRDNIPQSSDEGKHLERIRQLEEELASLRRSNSWKVTAPLRKISQLLGRKQ